MPLNLFGAFDISAINFIYFFYKIIYFFIMALWFWFEQRVSAALLV